MNGFTSKEGSVFVKSNQEGVERVRQVIQKKNFNLFEN